MQNKDAIQQELETILTRNPNRLLLPEEVVEFAKNPKTALHSRFTWDDAAAAHNHRLQQARETIRLFVVTIPHTNKEIQAYVHVKEKPSDVGYRKAEVVAGNEILRELYIQGVVLVISSLQKKLKIWGEFAEYVESLEKLKTAVQAKKVRRTFETSQNQPHA